MKKLSKIILCILCSLSLIACSNTTTQQEEVKEEEIVETNESSTSYEEYDEINKEWDSKKAINSDYQGKIYFESGLIDLDFVQADDNEKYSRVDWKTMTSDQEGSVYMDYECKLNSRNIILYGHYVYPEIDPTQTHMFSPLQKLTKQENYEENKYIYIQFEKEIRKYEICNVFYCQLEEENGTYYCPDDMPFNEVAFTTDEFETYKKRMLECAFYQTGVDFDHSDQFLTLQTCVYNDESQMLIIFSKLVETVKTRE